MQFFLKNYGFKTEWLKNPKQEDINKYMNSIREKAT